MTGVLSYYNIYLYQAEIINPEYPIVSRNRYLDSFTNYIIMSQIEYLIVSSIQLYCINDSFYLLNENIFGIQSLTKYNIRPVRFVPNLLHLTFWLAIILLVFSLTIELPEQLETFILENWQMEVQKSHTSSRQLNQKNVDKGIWIEFFLG